MSAIKRRNGQEIHNSKILYKKTGREITPDRSLILHYKYFGAVLRAYRYHGASYKKRLRVARRTFPDTLDRRTRYHSDIKQPSSHTAL